MREEQTEGVCETSDEIKDVWILGAEENVNYERKRKQQYGENFMVKIFIICIFHAILWT